MSTFEIDFNFHTQPLIKGGPWHRMRGEMLKVASALAVDVVLVGKNPRQVQCRNGNRNPNGLPYAELYFSTLHS